MRRILWNIYAWPMTLLLAASYFYSINEFQSIKCLDLAFSIPSLIALHFHIWDKKIGTSDFWKPYAFFFIVWELAYNLLLDPMLKHEKFDPNNMIVWILLLPLYVGMVLYAFRKWTENKTPNKQIQPTANGLG